MGLQRKCIIFLVTCLGLVTLNAQRVADSLKQVISKSGPDTNRANALNDLGRQLFIGGRTDTALKLTKQALELSEKLAFKKGIAVALGGLGSIYTRTGNYAEALEKTKRSLKLREEIGDEMGAAGCYNNMANISVSQDNYTDALKNYRTALTKWKSLLLKTPIPKNLSVLKNKISLAHNNLGHVYWQQGNFNEALKEYYEALRIKDETGDEAGKAQTRNNIGLVYGSENNFEEALKNFSIALKISEKINDLGSIARAHENIGNVYYLWGRYQEALPAHEKALRVFIEQEDKYNIAAVYSNIGNIHDALGNKTAAMENYRLSLKLREEIGDQEGIAISLINIASTLDKLGKTKEAYKLLKRALAIGLETGNKERIEGAYKALADVDSITGDYKNAFTHFKLYIAYRDSLVNEENTKKAVQQQMQYDFDKKSAADSIKNAEAKRIEEISHQSQIANQKLYTYAGLAGFLIMVVIAAVSFVAFRNKKKANKEIQKQKNIVEMKQKEILDSIYYARRIQRALITNESYIKSRLSLLKKKAGL